VSTKKEPILIIGQGISGTMLSWYLYQQNIPFLIMDQNAANTASKVAAGIINPVTGRRIVKTWNIDEIMPFAINAYREIGSFLNITTYASKTILDFFPTLQMKNAFAERIAEKADYLSPQVLGDFQQYIHYQYGYGCITPCYTVYVEELILAWKQFLVKKELYIEDTFLDTYLQYTTEAINYKSLKAAKVIFADGISSYNNPWFKNLPFAFNKGEALILAIPNLPTDYIYKKGLTICPLSNGLFWVGANYSWDYTHNEPTPTFKKQTTDFLKSCLRLDFTIIDHKAAIRPANVERRPFVGFHPVYKNVGILNGMGAKGTSLAPYFANALVQNIINNTPILAEAAVERFAKVLSRK
jgi:glycine/D-amino acid oxidase-like deaminating enzyme